jgi:hypothetical protein
VDSFTRTQCFLLHPSECENITLSVQMYRHILHFRCFFTLPFVPVWSNVVLKNSSMSAVLPSRVVPESATVWTSTSVGIPSLLTASKSVMMVVLRFLLANGFTSVHTTRGRLADSHFGLMRAFSRSSSPDSSLAISSTCALLIVSRMREVDGT